MHCKLLRKIYTHYIKNEMRFCVEFAVDLCVCLCVYVYVCVCLSTSGSEIQIRVYSVWKEVVFYRRYTRHSQRNKHPKAQSDCSQLQDFFCFVFVKKQLIWNLPYAFFLSLSIVFLFCFNSCHFTFPYFTIYVTRSNIKQLRHKLLNT